MAKDSNKTMKEAENVVSGDSKTNWSSRSSTGPGHAYRTEGRLNVHKGFQQLGQDQAQRRPLKKIAILPWGSISNNEQRITYIRHT